MKKQDGRKFSIQVQEQLRVQAVTLKKQGYLVKEIAGITGVHRTTVTRWLSLFNKKGKRAFKGGQRGRRVGACRKLTAAQETTLKNIILKKTPAQFDLNSSLWDRLTIKALIKKKTKVDLPIRTVGWYLQRWGYTPQKPKKRAQEREPELVEQWLKETYPKIKAKAKKMDAEIHWGDETGLNTQDFRGRTYSPKGKTPIKDIPLKTRQTINIISSVTNGGKLRFMIFESSFNISVFTRFLSRLSKSLDRKIFLIVDNHRVHKSKKVQKWLSEQEKIKVFYLPPYSPDLNPDEFFNNDLKQGVSRKITARTKADLKKSARAHMVMLQRNPQKVSNYFKASSISYAA